MNQTIPASTFAATIGLDWANQKHDLWIQAATGGKPEHQILEQTPEAIHEWVAKMSLHFPNQRIAIAIETSRGAIISALQAYSFIVLYPINPKMLCSYREAFCVSGAKDDRTDAMLLEEYVRFHFAKLRALQPDTELTRKLGGLVENRRDLVDERTRLVNQLHSLLKTYYPLMEVLFDDLTTLLATQFLLKWPDLASAKKAGAAGLRKFFYGHNCRSAKTIEQRLQALEKAQPLTTDPALIEPAVLKVKALAGMLKVLHEAIEEIESQTNRAMDAHPDAPLFRSFPAPDLSWLRGSWSPLGPIASDLKAPRRRSNSTGLLRSKSRAAKARSSTCATAAPNLAAKPFTKMRAMPSEKKVGPKSSMTSKESAKKATMRPCVL